MAKAMHSSAARGEKTYAKKINDHIALALIAYTMALIFGVTPAMKTEGGSILPYFLLVVFVALMVPFCRNIDNKWKKLDGSELGDSNLKSRYAIDRTKLWMVALGVPILLWFLFSSFK